MPAYPYKCPDCGERREVVKSMCDAQRMEVCSCGQGMMRVWVVPGAVVSKCGDFDYGLGKYIANPAQRKDEIKRMREPRVTESIHKDPETGEFHTVKHEHPGVDLVEVGNDRRTMKSIKPKRNPYLVPAW